MKVVSNSSGRRVGGFTVVELIIVVSVIAILAAIVVVSYGSWRTRINSSVVRSDLIAAATAMENSRNQDGAYPTSLPTTFSPSKNVVITVIGATDKAFCLNGTYSTAPTIQYYTDETIKSAEPKTGTCASRTIANKPALLTNVTNVMANATQVRVQWSLASPNYATSYEIECAQDGAYITQVIKGSAATATATSTLVSGADSSASYFCRVRAVNANGKSEWSNAPASGNTTASTCADTGQFGTFPSCYAYDSLAVGTSISGYWTTVPEGYLLENGAAVSRTTYADLFALIGTTYGAGNGTTTFNLPDSRGRATVSVSSVDAEFDSVGEKYGEKNHTLTVNEMPSHGHNQYVTANTGSSTRIDYSSDGASAAFSQGTNTNSNGSSAPYSVVQPSIAKNYAIKFRPSTGSTSMLPAGATLQGYWNTAPTGYLNENGVAVSRTANSALFSVLGTTFGTGDGTSTFGLPDSEGKIGVGIKSGDADFGTRGQVSGEKQHLLTIAEMVNHSHGQIITAPTGGGTAIRHDYVRDGAGGVYDQGQATGSTGGGQAHNIIQPSIAKRSTIKSGGASGTQQDAGIKPGTSIEGWWATVPSGYLLEDGAAVSRTTYSALFAIIGTTHGAGNGTTTFNLPDSRGRVGVNVNATDTEFSAVGVKFGTKTHIMTLAELPSHSHAQYVTANSGCCGVRRDFTGDATSATYAQGVNTGSNGGGAAFNILQPSIAKMTVIKI